MRLYDIEKNDGIVFGDNKTTVVANAQVQKKEKISDGQAVSAVNSVKELLGFDQPDLALIVSILVSAGWNLNDDIFVPSELWAAKETPIHKPINDNHNGDKILGHIVTSMAVDKEGNQLILDENDNIPDNFDLEVIGVLYKAVPELKDKIDAILEQANSGEMFVSMEAWFTDFAYGFMDTKNNIIKVLDRDENTAFLTKHLRIYGGSGKFKGLNIGRVLKNITFGGKGFVTTPANPESIIKVIACKNIEEIGLKDLKGGTREVKTKANDETVDNKDVQTTSTELDISNKDLEKTKVELKETVEALSDANSQIKEKDDNIVGLETKVGEANKNIDDLNVQLKSQKTKSSDLEKELDELKVDLDKANKELDNIRQTEIAKERLAKIKEVKDIKDEDASLAELKEMTDETFNLLLKYAGNSSDSDTTENVVEDKVEAHLDTVKEQVEPEFNVTTDERDAEDKIARSVAYHLVGQNVPDDV